MRDIWYADNRDLVKWSVLIHLAKKHDINNILQLAYYRTSEFGSITVNGTEFPIPVEVKDHFRNINNIRNIAGSVAVEVFDQEFKDRNRYLNQAIATIEKYKGMPVIIFLDPDTGLEPNNPTLNHVLDIEANKIWASLKTGDIIVFYQHQTNRNGRPWVEPKRKQFSNAINEPIENIKIASGNNIARDVVFFYAKKA